MKRLLFVCLLVFVGIAVTAQTKLDVVRVYKIADTAADTVNKDGSKTYGFYIPNYCTSAKFQVHQLKTKGVYAKTKTYIETSLDYVNWTKLDSVSVAGNTYGTSALKTPYTNYIRLRTVGIDSTQTTKLKYYLLIDKKP